MGAGQFDVIVIGSGFGGAVMACRLAEKGHKVLILERGRRWPIEDYPREAGDAWIFDPNRWERKNGWIDFRLRPVDSDDLIRARAMGFQLRGGYELLVGRDMYELERFRTVLGRTLGWGLAITAGLALAFAALAERPVERC